MESRDDQCRNYMKMGKTHLWAGRIEAAERCFLIALEMASDYQSAYASRRGIITHRLATTAAERGDTGLARRRFQQAERRIKNDPLGLAICLRDHGELELSVGDYDRAQGLNDRAQAQLRRAALTRPTERLDIEFSTTEAFLAHVDILEGRNIATAIQVLRDVATELRSYERKPVYEFTLVLWLIDSLPHDEEREDCIARAIELSTQLGNTDRRLELQALALGGLPGREAYRLSAHLLSFGVNTLKGIVRIFTN